MTHRVKTWRSRMTACGIRRAALRWAILATVQWPLVDCKSCLRVAPAGIRERRTLADQALQAIFG